MAVACDVARRHNRTAKVPDPLALKILLAPILEQSLEQWEGFVDVSIGIGLYILVGCGFSVGVSVCGKEKL